MALVQTPAIILSHLRYGETSKIVRFATRDLGVQSAIAKGALRPRSRFGAALQVLSGGQAHLLVKENRDLHLLTAFDLQHLRVGLTAYLPRYTTGMALAEVMLRFAPPDPHPEAFDLFGASLDSLEVTPPDEVPALGLRLLWLLISALGFAPSLELCARDGAPVPAEGPLPFNIREGGALCASCAALLGANRLPPEARLALARLIDGQAALPALDARHLAAHQRLLSGYIRCHLAESTELPALDFWLRRAPG